MATISNADVSKQTCIFAPKASVLLLGDRGTGKSTLGIIASVAFRKRLVDFDAFFHDQTGHRAKEFVEKYGDTELAAREATLIDKMLSAHHQGCIIVCATDSIPPSGQPSLKTFAETHPVIQIKSNLVASGEVNVLNAGEASNSQIAHSYSNYEYYNLAEPGVNNAHHRPIYPDGSPFLALKRVEQDFLRFLRSISGNGELHVETEYSRFPLVSRTPFTYVLSLSLTEVQTLPNLEAVLQNGADAVEICIALQRDITKQSALALESMDTISKAFTSVRRLFAGPIFYHFQRTPEVDTATYLQFLHHGLRLCPDFLTVYLSCDDDTISTIITSKGSTKVIGHDHELSPESGAWLLPAKQSKLNRAKYLGCQIVRLTQEAQSMADNLDCQSFINFVEKSSKNKIPLIAYNTGLMGRTSCCFNQIFTPVAPHYPTRSSEQRSAWLVLREAQTALYSSFVLNQLVFFIVGIEVSSSLSPPMYRTAFRELGMPHQFKIKSMPSITDLKDVISDSNFGGASIAQGLKVSVIPHLQFISNHAKAIGAVNTLIPIRCHWEHGKSLPLQFWRNRNLSGPVKGLFGENTDWIGVYRCIDQRLSPVNAVSAKTTGVIIGAGGMARAAVYALMQLRVQHIFIYNRTPSKAHLLADYFNRLAMASSNGAGKDQIPSRLSASPRVHVIESLSQKWPESHTPPTIVVSCVRADGKTNEPQPMIQLPSDWLASPTGGVVVETAYEPLISPLLKQMLREARRGWITVDGLQLLPEQAAAQFEMFTGRRAPRIQMAIAVLQNYKCSAGPGEKLIQSRIRKLMTLLGPMAESLS